MSKNNDNSDLFWSLYPFVLYPLKYAKVLIQLGHEPLKPFLSHHPLSLINISKKRLCYPWIGSYVYYIYKKRGFAHIFFTTFVTRSFTDCFSTAIEEDMHREICQSMNYDDREIEDVVEECNWNDFLFIMFKLTLSKSLVIGILYPFKVIITRQMADFIEEESKNEWFHKAAISIYNESGVIGFYKGFIPSIIGDVGKCALYYLICRVLRKILKLQTYRSELSEDVVVVMRRDKTLLFVFRSIFRYVCSNLFYPFEVVSTVMKMDNVRLSNGTVLSEYNNWRLCWRKLKLENQLYRGYSFVFRNHIQPL